jgi:hypothetical protein
MSRIGVEVPAAEEDKTPPKRKKTTGLPMPKMPGDEEVAP